MTEHLEDALWQAYVAWLYIRNSTRRTYSRCKVILRQGFLVVWLFIFRARFLILEYLYYRLVEGYYNFIFWEYVYYLPRGRYRYTLAWANHYRKNFAIFRLV